MPNTTQDSVSLFQKAVLTLLEGNRRLNESTPGEFEHIPNSAFSRNKGDLRVYIDEGFKKQARALNYEYIPTLSTADELVFLDTLPTYRYYSNKCEKVTFYYDYDLNNVQEIAIDE